jgi:hypothetical protein
VGNASLTGVALGLLFGEPIEGTYAGLYGFCLIIALLMTYVKNRARVSNDTVIGVVLAQVSGHRNSHAGTGDQAIQCPSDRGHPLRQSDHFKQQ